MRRTIGITGTPGTGKKTIAPLVATRLGLPCIAINDLALGGRRGALGRGRGDVDIAVLRRRVLAKAGTPCLLYGHMLPDALKRDEVQMAVVLRCDPLVLKGRLMKRGYSRSKMLANLEAELIGLVSSQTISRFGRDRVSEFDASSATPERAADSVARLLKLPRGRGPSVDWLERYRSAVKLRSLLSVERTESART